MFDGSTEELQLPTYQITIRLEHFHDPGKAGDRAIPEMQVSLRKFSIQEIGPKAGSEPQGSRYVGRSVRRSLTNGTVAQNNERHEAARRSVQL
jgi:hypothetical protein